MRRDAALAAIQEFIRPCRRIKISTLLGLDAPPGRPGFSSCYPYAGISDAMCTAVRAVSRRADARPPLNARFFYFRLTSRIAGRKKCGHLCTNQHPTAAHSVRVQVFFFFLPYHLYRSGFGIERRDTQLAAAANVTHVLKSD